MEYNSIAEKLDFHIDNIEKYGTFGTENNRTYLSDGICIDLNLEQKEPLVEITYSWDESNPNTEHHMEVLKKELSKYFNVNVDRAGFE